MKHLDLFSGIGGFALAASWVWGDEHEIVSFCEIDPFCQKVLKKHWPKAPIISDIRDVTYEKILADTDHERQQEQRLRLPTWDEKEGSEITRRGKSRNGTIDLLTGGFPCQPFSCAGKRQGERDDRFLWPEMLRVIREIHPTWIIGENVAGIINMALDQVLSELENEGYACQAFIVPACAVDAPHRRDRVWIVANFQQQGLEGFTGDVERGSQPGRINTETNGSTCKGSLQRNVADTERCACEKRRVRFGKVQKESRKTSDRFGNEREIQPIGWFPEPTVLRTHNGIPKKLDGGLKNGKTKEKRPDKTVQVLRHGTKKENNQWENGRQSSISKKSLLQQEVYGESVHKTHTNQNECWEAIPTSTEKTMRELWEFRASLPTPPRQKSKEQPLIEFKDAVQFVSHKLASFTGRHCSKENETTMLRLRKAVIQIGYVLHPPDKIQEVWESITYEETTWIIVAALHGLFHSEWPDIPRVTTGVKDRVNRLKAMGNAIVPQCVQPIMQAIKEQM